MRLHSPPDPADSRALSFIYLLPVTKFTYEPDESEFTGRHRMHWMMLWVLDTQANELSLILPPAVRVGAP